MKMFGQKITDKNIETIVIPRANGKDIIFKAAAILNMDDFNRYLPQPRARLVTYPGGVTKANTDDPTHKIAMQQYYARRMSWMVITSLDATEGLEWEKVKKDQPDTWELWESELEDSSFTNREIRLIFDGVMAANALNEEKIEAARQRFFLSQEEEKRSISQEAGVQNMQSGVVAKDSK
jgi:hypothetical protein